MTGGFKQRRVIGSLLRWVAVIGLVGYLVWFIAQNRELLAQRYDGTVWHAGLLVAGILATWVVSSLQTLIPLREVGARVGFWENLLVTVAAVFGNYLPMRAGTLLRLHYIKSVHGVGYLQYGGILGARALLLFWAAGSVGLCGATAMVLTGRPVRTEMFILFTAILFTGLAPFLLPLSKFLPARGRSGRVATELAGAIDLIRRNRRLTVSYLGLVMLQFCILAGRLSVAFDVIQERPSIWLYFFLGPVATILSFVSITPGNLGVREWIVGILSSGVGVEYVDGIFAPTIDRAVQILMTLSLGALAAGIVVLRISRRTALASP